MKKIILIITAILSFSLLSAQEKPFTPLPDSTVQIIDSIIHNGIRDQIFPGCQVFAMYKDHVILSKSYGYQTYNQVIPVNDSTLYDLASITKSAATSLAVMKLYDKHLIRLSDTIGQYLSYLRGTDKSKLTLIELLTHTSGLKAYIPFYKSIAGDTTIIHRNYSDIYCVKAADSVFIRYDYPDSVRYFIAHSQLGKKKYVYSDLGFLLLRDMIEVVTGMSLGEYLDLEFYVPMGLHHTCFNPLEKGITKDQIAPTEVDTFFRKQKVEGYVHDQTAAVFGGICGNAGLFSTATELAAIFQLLMNDGSYQGKSYLSAKTVHLFTSTYPIHQCRRRALGFDTPGFEKPSSILPAAAGNQTFGHQGFTGTVVWCDPAHQLIYIFLSNRVFPSTEPNKLSKSRIRLTVHEAIYKGLF